MAFVTGLTRGGSSWTPAFIEKIDSEKCIGCGRCFKVCARKVLAPEDYECEETESLRMIMTIVNGDNCIGCVACGTACSKKAIKFAPMPV